MLKTAGITVFPTIPWLPQYLKLFHICFYEIITDVSIFYGTVLSSLFQLETNNKPWEGLPMPVKV